MDDWSDYEVSLVIVFSCAIVTFIIAYIAVTKGVRNELVHIKRISCITFTLAFIEVALLLTLLGFELARPQTVQWPSFGVVRPGVGLVLGLFSFFLVSHPFFRWLAVLHMLLFVSLNAFTNAELHKLIQCRGDGTCTATSDWSIAALQAMWVRNMIDMFFQVWMLLWIMALQVGQGCCSSRYPPRLFDTSAPLSYVPRSHGGTPLDVMGNMPSSSDDDDQASSAAAGGAAAGNSNSNNSGDVRHRPASSRLRGRISTDG